jgi:hypothetical protein
MNDNIREQLDAMKAEHRRLDDEITTLSVEPVYDQLEIARLKRRKLQLKDQIQQFLDRNTPDLIA